MRDLIKLIVLLLLVLFFHSTVLPANTEVTIGDALQVKAVRLTGKVDLDGKLNEPFWKDENAVSRFVQRDPVEGATPTEVTKVDVLYDDDAIYVGARMYDSSPSEIEARLQRKDVSVASDTFMFYVDPYLDRRTGYYFGINAAGTLYDGTLLNDSWDSNSWDGVWEGRAHIDEKGWTAELRIPFSQLRFGGSESNVWGVNFKRTISRKNENVYLVFTPKNGSGFVSRFPEMTGLENISPGRSVQLIPYITSRASFAPAEVGDPFHSGSAFDPGVGADLTTRVGTGLKLNATFNPDFGQVEVDPAVVNLSDVETFYPEKRPFFVEGSSIFEFGQGGATNYWSFNWSGPQFFYSRRIGRAPQGSPEDADYTSMPDGTTILGAGKLTGRLWNKWNVGTLHAFTARETAQLSTGSVLSSQEVEPATYYEVTRMQREFRDGRQGIGFITTLADRFFQDPQLQDQINNNALTLGVDGWTFLDDDKVWVLAGYTGFTHITGTAARITELQESSQRYYQRPDADYVELDPDATSLNGSVGRVYLNKEKGNVFLNAAFGFVSPGFDVNDLGFQWRADQINTHTAAGYKWTEPRKFYRYAEVGGAAFQTWDFGGDTTWQGIFHYGYIQFKNYYTLDWNFAYNPETVNNFRTRGGPKSLNNPGYQTNFYVTTDSRKPWVFTAGSFTYEAEQEHTRSYNFSVQWKPVSNLSVEVGPSYETLRTPAQWIDSFDDPLMVATYGKRYVFGDFSQKTFAANIRVNWTFTPSLSLQFFGQPLISSGDYSDFGELAQPRTYDFNRFAQAGTVHLEDGVYTIDPDGAGPATPFSFDDPNFNYKSLRGNAVLRWEYRPGSTLYFVWTQTRTDEEVNGEFRLGRSLSQLFQTEADNVIMVKFTYYWNF